MDISLADQLYTVPIEGKRTDPSRTLCWIITTTSFSPHNNHLRQVLFSPSHSWTTEMWKGEKTYACLESK